MIRQKKREIKRKRGKGASPLFLFKWRNMSLCDSCRISRAFPVELFAFNLSIFNLLIQLSFKNNFQKLKVDEGPRNSNNRFSKLFWDSMIYFSTERERERDREEGRKRERRYSQSLNTPQICQAFCQTVDARPFSVTAKSLHTFGRVLRTWREFAANGSCLPAGKRSSWWNLSASGASWRSRYVLASPVERNLSSCRLQLHLLSFCFREWLISTGGALGL